METQSYPREYARASAGGMGMMGKSGSITASLREGCADVQGFAYGMNVHIGLERENGLIHVSSIPYS